MSDANPPSPRPAQISGLETQQIRETVAANKELADTHRLYIKEWLVRSSHHTEESANIGAQAIRDDGRILPDDVRVMFHTGSGLFKVETRLWNVRGEFKFEHDAEEARKQLDLREQLEGRDSHIEVVVRNSRAEHQLKAYGTVKLVKPSPSAST